MKNLSKLFLCLIIVLCAVMGCFGVRSRSYVSADSSSHVVTFNYNTKNIMEYLPDNTSIKNTLKTYSVTVGNGGYAVESSKPSSLINPYYSYEWTYNGSVVDLSTFQITRDITFVASWTARQYSVNFNFESVDVKNQISNLQTHLYFSVESPRINLYRPIREHYYFEGWYNGNNSIEILYVPARSVGDKVYTARFSPIEYYIDYNTDAVHENNRSYNIEDDDFTLFDPSKEGHIFNGWYTDETYKTRVTTFDTSKGGNIDLYPLWELEVYKVTYILPNGLSRVVECEYGAKADLPKLNKSIFEIVKTDVSRNNITGDTVIHLEYVNIWYVYVIALVLIAGIVTLVIVLKRRRDNIHKKLRLIYQTNANKKSRKY